MQPVPPPNGQLQAITAERAEVLLPDGACDRFQDPWTLLASCDAERPAKLDSVLTYVTISEPSTERLHEQWSRCRSWVGLVVDALKVPVLLVQHAPHRQANPNPPHIHALLMGPRRMTSLGWCAPVPDLMRDGGRDVLLDNWQQHIERW